MLNSRLCENERPRDLKKKNTKLHDVKSAKDESSRATTSASKISRSGQTFPRPNFVEEPFYTPNYSRWFSRQGGLAQMVERPLCMREVLGSIPRFSIFFLFELTVLAATFIRKKRILETFLNE